jgi:hypothetical protein
MESAMNCPFEAGPKTLMILSHPNHELPILGLIRRLSPTIIFLTDGGGQDRVGQSRKGLKDNLGDAIFLDYPEREFYRALLAGNSDYFLGVAKDVARSAVFAPERVFCDAVEFYNPVHDISLPVTISALSMLGLNQAPIFEVPLIRQVSPRPESYEVQRACPGMRGGEIRWRVGDTQTAEKVGAWYETYTILSSTMAPVVPNPAVTASIESVYVCGSPMRDPEVGQLRYERRGALLKELGDVEQVITREHHYLPAIEPLLAV